MTIADQWRSVVARLRVRHADREAVPMFEVFDGEPPTLFVHVINARDTVTDARLPDLAVSSVALTFWPGDTLALRWLAAAWAGYVQHEALELVTLEDGTRPIDPHAAARFDRGLRNGLPVVLTPETMRETFLAVMPVDVVEEMYAVG